MLTSARHSWPLSSEGSLVCHTFCDVGHLFIMVISKDLSDTCTYCRAFGDVTTCFRLSWLGFKHPTFHLRGEHSNPLHHRLMAPDIWKHHIYTHTVLQNVSLICCNKIFLQRIMFFYDLLTGLNHFAVSSKAPPP